VDINPTKMTAKLMVVTVTMAQAWLLKTHPRQRRRNMRRVATFVADRLANRWALTHQGIAFDIDGFLIDGQHRLEMIVRSGVATAMWVFENCPRESFLHLDEQTVRPAHVCLNMAGEGDYSIAEVSVARNFTIFPLAAKSNSISKEMIRETLLKYQPAISFAMNGIERSPGFTRSVRTLTARAFYHLDNSRLSDWCQVLSSGMPVSDDSNDDMAAITYRTYLLRNTRSVGDANEAEKYHKGQSALESFVRRKWITKLYGTKEDVFPLPSEDQRAKKHEELEIK
jgi:hypothetical protein